MKYLLIAIILASCTQEEIKPSDINIQILNKKESTDGTLLYYTLDVTSEYNIKLVRMSTTYHSSSMPYKGHAIYYIDTLNHYTIDNVIMHYGGMIEHTITVEDYNLYTKTIKL